MTTPFVGGATAATHAARAESLAALRGRLEAANAELSTGRVADAHRALGATAVRLIDLEALAAGEEGQLSANRILRGRLDAMDLAMGGIIDAVDGFLRLAIPNRDAPGGTIDALQRAAVAAYDAVVAQSNASHAGAQLFSGLDADQPALNRWSEVDGRTGLSPEAVLTSMLGGGLANGPDAAAKAAVVAAAFGDADAAQPDRNFERTFYAGTAAEAAPGVPSARLSARIATTTDLAYGIQANDPAFRDALRGLAMVAAVDTAQIDDPDAYGAWVRSAIDDVAAGLAGMRDAHTRLGTQRAALDATTDRQDARARFYAVQAEALRGVDPYEAAVRVNALSTQLEASFATTARLMRLSFLAHM